MIRPALLLFALGVSLAAEPVVSITRTTAPVTIVQWNANPPEERVAGYYLYVWQGAGPAQRIQVAGSTSWTITGMSVGQTYRVAVSAYNADGVEGQASEAIDATQGAGTTVLSVTASEGTLQKSLDLRTWRDVPSPYLTSERVEPRAFFRILTPD
jgi:hypothetical protein